MKNKGLAVLVLTASLSASLLLTPVFGCLPTKNPPKPMKNAEMVMGQAQAETQDQSLLLQSKNTGNKEKQIIKITPN
ncbi:MAG: hypothetical protein GX197_07995 [Firmicutes bacterium]|nr:hypothetical protein [Bacillota bacterium]